MRPPLRACSQCGTTAEVHEPSVSYPATYPNGWYGFAQTSPTRLWAREPELFCSIACARAWLEAQEAAR